MRAQGHNPSVITGKPPLIHTQHSRQRSAAFSLCYLRVCSGDKANSQEDRVRVYEEFERGVTKVLISTDLMTRGIDMPGMKLVINFDLPWLYEEGSGFKGGHVHFATFQHRVGRVGRFGHVSVRAFFFQCHVFMLSGFLATSAANTAGRCCHSLACKRL
jgi:superfamily II DNA/RNA helicase